MISSCFQVVFKLFSSCFQVVFKLFSSCFQVVFKLFSSCFQVVFKLFSSKKILVFMLFSSCFQVVFKLFSSCFQVVFNCFFQVVWDINTANNGDISYYLFVWRNIWWRDEIFEVAALIYLNIFARRECVLIIRMNVTRNINMQRRLPYYLRFVHVCLRIREGIYM